MIMAAPENEETCVPIWYMVLGRCNWQAAFLDFELQGWVLYAESRVRYGAVEKVICSARNVCRSHSFDPFFHSFS